MKAYVLASGSKGNMTYLKVGDIKLFIDAGISFQKMKKKMTDYGENIYDVNTLFLTHEHHDHVLGLKALVKEGHIRDLYLTKGTYNELPSDVTKQIDNIHIIEIDQPFKINDLTIHPFSASHDAKEPVGFVISNPFRKMVYLTDTGYVDETYYDLLKDADLYIFEANHNPFTLFQSSRPFLLKKRIVGEKGHLSNEDAAKYMNIFTMSKKAIWVVAHISEDCNTTLDIDEAIIKCFNDPTQVEVHYASQESLKVIEV